uniref:Odorant receptor n=1 Tax=Campoletis chlorideae TaxID=219166 RepID=A0A346D3X4_9HYME|nr:odorant receptor [Campoletis chlorideae]
MNMFCDENNENMELKPVVLNKDHKSDISHMVYYTKKLLGILGVWSLGKKNPPKREIVMSTILIIACSLEVSFIMVPCILHVLLREKIMLLKIKLLAPIGVRAMNLLKYWMLIRRRNVIKYCFDHVEYDWVTAGTVLDREIMHKNANTGRSITLSCIIIMYTSTWLFNGMMPLLRGKKLDALNRTIRPLAYPGYDIFIDSQSSPVYELIYCNIILSAWILYTIIATPCSLAAIFVAHACGQIQIIFSRLDTLFDNLDNQVEILNQRVSFIVRCHVRVLRLASKIEEALNEIVLIEVLTSTSILCLLEYYCMTEWENSDNISVLTYFLLLVSLSLNIFIFSHNGELLKEQCSQIGKATYLTDWWKMPGKTGQALVLVISMANIPRQLTAGRMIELSVASFGAIMRATVMYLNMLRALNI